MTELSNYIIKKYLPSIAQQSILFVDVKLPQLIWGSRMLTAKAAARMIDISAVRAQHGIKDIEELVAYGKTYRFINLHVLPAWVPALSELIRDEPDILVGAPVGFPGGGHTTEIKIAEARQLLRDGVQEMDIVMNVGRFLSGEYDYVLDELRAITDVVAGRVPTKVIIEFNVLSDDEILKACDLVIASGASYVKTSTGWIGAPLDMERIQMMKRHCGSAIKIKAAGGIRTTEEFLALVDLGVERMGINTLSAVSIVQSLPQD